MENLNLWHSVDKTEPSATKTSNQGGRQQTSINGYWMIKQATERFGPVGIGWGWDVMEERWDDGAVIPLKQDDGSTRLEQSKTHTIKLKLWFVMDGKRGEITQYGHTQAIYKSKYGVSDDGEAPKKSLMDAIKKALSMLGFSADIFMGMFEDQNYVNERQIEEAISRDEEREADAKAKRDEVIASVENTLKAIANAANAGEVRAYTKAALIDLNRKKNLFVIADLCTAGINRISIESEKRTKELSQ